MFGAAILKFFRKTGKLLVAPLVLLGKFFKAWFTGQLPIWVNWLLEFLLVALLVILLGALNWGLGLDRYLVGPLMLRKVWLGLVALLTYATVRLFSLLLQGFPREAGFRDIRLAMRRGQEGAAAARINIQETPLFLVLGLVPEVEEAMVSSPLVANDLQVDDADLPVHWYGNTNALWVTLPGVSAVAAQAERAWEDSPTAESPRLNHAEKELAQRRLEFFIHLLRKLRGPIVPINGLLLMVPYRWLEDPVLSQLADTIALDMRTAQRELGVKCVCLTVFYGIEQSAEFREYIRRMPETALQRRCGCTLAPMTQYVDDDVEPMHQWLCRFLREQVYYIYQDEHANPANGKLYRFLETLQHANKSMHRILTNAFSDDIREHFYLGGAYFAELGPSGRSFFDGVAAKLLHDHDDAVGWNQQSLRRDRRWKTLASITALAVIVLVTLNAGLAIVLVSRLLSS